MQPPIVLKDIWKSYGKTQAVRGLSLSVPARSVYGFLGPNGAGKSTTIRLILGLQRPDRGSIALFGQPHRTSSLARIGSLVESPSLYPHLTGRENLEVHRRLLDAPPAAVDRALETVGLTAAAQRAAHGYSMGMKQRLGLAQALLGDPELLLLDEPTNGLDPAGIHEIRELVRELPDRCGVTVFLSSHLLSEIEQVATHIAIISEGQARFQGSAEELRHFSEPVIEAEVDDVETAMNILTRHGISAHLHEGRLKMSPHAEHGSAQINAMLVRAGVGVSHLATRHPALEDIFLTLTSSAAQEAAVG